MAAAQADDFALDWDLPEYPQLPKMFTSAKAAKKRKHKEFILTDADLDTVVKIPKAGAAGTTPKKTLEAAASKQTDPDAPAAAAAAESLSTKAEHKRQKREAKLLAAQQAAGSAGASSREGEAASLLAEPARKKKKKSSTAQEQQQQEQGAPGEAAAQQLDDSTGAGLPKKSRKNKFKTQEFLQQQQQQQEQQQQADLLHEQQQAPKKRKAATQQDLASQHQQQQQPSPEQPSCLSKKQKQKLKKTQQQQQQQQQQLANGNGSKAAAAPVAAAAAATKAPSHKERSSPAAAPAAGGSAGGSKLLQQFKERLQGSRFRQLNEALYTQPGDASFSTMQQQPQLFEQYHEGFQQQVKAWPSQPLDAAIKWLGPKPSDWVVADFGCGEARLAATVQQTVHSLDLVAVAPGVIECNMAHTPLETGSCNVAVFSLALMGTDYGSFLLEASRVLKPGGWLWVAEVRSRFADGKSGKEDFRPLLAALKALGFRLVQQDTANRMFVVWVLQMKGDAGKQSAAGAIKWPPLRACVYKKR